jgi:hypothetical protein
MFNYISDILSNFTPQQRIFALLLLLLSIILMTNGGDLIKAVKGVPDDVEIVLKTQQKQIQMLQLETTRLNNIIVDVRMECTDMIMKRELEIANQIQQIINVGRRTETVSRSISSVDTVIVLPMMNEPMAPNSDYMLNRLIELRKSLLN